MESEVTQLTLSLAGSRNHAKTSASPENRPALTMAHAPASGPKSPVLLAKFDPASSSWRTSQHCLVALLNGQADGLAEFSETWPRSGMMSAGIAYQLPPLAPLTRGTAPGSWPTPRANKIGGYSSPGYRPTLEQAVKEMWPTPTVNDAKNNGSASQMQRNSLALNCAVKMWPTPRASDADKGGRGDLIAVVRTGLPSGRKTWPTPHANCHTGAGAGPNKQGAENLQTAIGGALNPTWVEWLMGFPTGWTDLKPSETP